MVLCDLCKSIDFASLPTFPDDVFRRSITGFDYLQTIHFNREQPGELPSLGVPHHGDLESLRRAAAAGCHLCRLVEKQADGILKDAEVDEEEERKHRSILRYEPTFELWLSKRPALGDGLWFMTKDRLSANTSWRRHIPAAALGFCVDDGALSFWTSGERPLITSRPCPRPCLSGTSTESAFGERHA